MASLYDDLEVTKGGGASKWASPAPSSFSMLQSHVAARKQTTQARSAATRTAKAAPPTLAPVLDLGRSTAAAPPTSVEGEYRFNQQTGRLEKVANITASPFIGDPTLCLGVTDEYNPLYPNDYEVSRKMPSMCSYLVKFYVRIQCIMYNLCHSKLHKRRTYELECGND